jgi:sugar lactone lactonase YvrE
MRHILVWAVFGTITVTLSAQVAPGTYSFTTLAGRAGSTGSADGTGNTARFLTPWGVTVDAAGNIYVVEAGNHTVRRVTPAGAVTTLAGQAGVPGSADGTGTAAQFGVVSTQAGATATSPTGPFGLAIDSTGTLIVADGDNHTLRRIADGNVVTLFAGGTGRANHLDGPLLESRFNVPMGVAIDATGAMFVADCFNHVVRRISSAGMVTTIAGTIGDAGFSDGVGSAARFLHPTAITVDPMGNVYVVDCNNTVRKMSPIAGTGTWETTTIAGTAGTYGSTDGVGSTARFGTAPPAGSTGVLVSLYFTLPPSAVVASENGFTTLLIATNSGNFNLGELRGIAADGAGNVYVTDATNNTIRKISPTRVVTTIGGTTTAGSADGFGTAARFNRPAGIAVDAAGNLYIADASNQTIRKGAIASAPAIQSQPANQTIALGSNVTLSLVVTGTPTPTFQWTRNNVVIAGATNSSLTLNNIQASQAGTYSVTVSNSLGISATTPFVLSVTAIPVFTVQPANQTVNGGETIRLTASATGAPAYQWFRDGQPITGATSAALTVTNAQSTSAGDYTVVASNSFGSVTSNVSRVVVNVGRIINLSIRSALSGSEPLIVGFVTAGGDKSMLIRAIGPALRDFGVSAAMSDPQLALYAGTTLMLSNDNWSAGSSATTLPAAAIQVGAFALPANSLDAAILTDVNAPMTAQASARNAAGGIVLVELYDAAASSPARLINVSARARVGVGENALFAGFVIGGTSARSVLIRAIGPSLTAFGISGALADPRLDVFSAGSTTARASNDNWAGATALVNAFTSVGAFPLPLTASRDAALVTTLPAGAYTAQVSGVGNSTGEALLEIYELP